MRHKIVINQKGANTERSSKPYVYAKETQTPVKLWIQQGPAVQMRTQIKQ